MPKTGSSALQQALSRDLRDPDIHYIRPGRINASVPLQLGFDPRFNLPVWNIRPPWLSDSAHRRHIRRKLARGLRHPARIKILSGESLFNMRPHAFTALLDFIRPYDDEIILSGYLRPPHSYCESALQQILRYRFHPLNKPLIYPNYLQNLQKFESAVGRDNLHLGLYTPSLARSGLVEDFCQRHGLPRPADPAKRVNLSLSAPALQLLFHYRRRHKEFRMRSHFLIPRLARLEGPKLRLHPKFARQLIAVQPGEKAKIRRRYDLDLREDLDEARATGFRSRAAFARVDIHALEWLIRETRSPGLSARQLQSDPNEIGRLAAKLCRPRWLGPL